MSIFLNQNHNLFYQGLPQILTAAEAYYDLIEHMDPAQLTTVVSPVVDETQKLFKPIHELNQVYLSRTVRPLTRQSYLKIIEKYSNQIPNHVCRQIISGKYACNKKDFVNFLHSRKIKLSETLIQTILSTKFQV